MNTKFFESIYNEALLQEKRSKVYYTASVLDPETNDWIKVSDKIIEEMNQKDGTDKMAAFIGKTYNVPADEVRVEPDNTIGW